MRKKLFLILGLLVMLFGLGTLLASQEKKVWLRCEDDNRMSIKVVSGLRHKTVYPWENEGVAYFFLPAFADQNIYIDGTQIEVDGIVYGQGERLEWEDDKVYKVNFRDTVFMKSENIPSIFIDTDSGNMDRIHEGNPDYLEAGNIDVILSDGQLEYSGQLEKVSLRGNSTRDYPKKPYAIKLKQAKALCGMAPGKRWNLLAGWREGSKMNNKIALDMAKAMGLNNSISSTWVDLYLNGEYHGIYLLCEVISVGEEGIPLYDLDKDNKAMNPDIEMAEVGEEGDMKWYDLEDGKDITGGYLIEKEYPQYYETQTNGFMTELGNPFIIKSPKQASKEQVAYIKDYVQNIEKLIVEGDEDYREFIDIDGFSKKFLVDEISLNFDTGVTSMYLYKERGDDVLYGGPVWDYDTAFGCVKPFYNTPWNSYRYSVLENSRGLVIWYQAMYEDQAFYDTMLENYTNVLPWLEEMVDHGIDDYARYISASVKMNDTRWKAEEERTNICNAGHYISFEANVKHLKYFLAHRLNYLNDRWGVAYKELKVPAGEAEHKVTFLEDEGESVIWVTDGAVLEELPYYDKDKYAGWYFSYSNEEYFDELPIYEDVVFRRKVR